MVSNANERTMAPKNSIASIKGILCIVAVVISLAGAITIWATQDGNNNTLTYWSAMLFVASVVNLVAYIFNASVAFAFTATIFFIGFSGLLANAELFRRAGLGNQSRDGKAVYAGTIVLLIGVTLSFAGLPFGAFGWATIIDLVVLGVVAIHDIIGGALFANINDANTSAQIFIVLAIFAIAILFASRTMMYTTLVLATIILMTVLPRGFGPRGNSTRRKEVAGAAITFAGMLVKSLWIIISVHFFRHDVDRFDSEEEPQHRNGPKTNTTTNTTHQTNAHNA